MELSLSAINRFRDRVKRTDGCWLWIGATDSSGYGHLTDRRKTISVHRISYFLHEGDPGDMQVLHTCDNPICCNPEHLFLGTNLDNMKDRQAKGRYASNKGERSNFAQHSDELVSRIRAFLNSGLSQAEVARKFGISDGYVSKLANGKLRS